MNNNEKNNLNQDMPIDLLVDASIYQLKLDATLTKCADWCEAKTKEYNKRCEESVRQMYIGAKLLERMNEPVPEKLLPIFEEYKPMLDSIENIDELVDAYEKEVLEKVERKSKELDTNDEEQS